VAGRRGTDSWEAELPEPVQQAVWQENEEFLRCRAVFDADFFKFVWRLVCLYPPSWRLPAQAAGASSSEGEEWDPVLRSLQFGWSFVQEVYARAKDKPLLGQWAQYLARSLATHRSTQEWCLTRLVERPAALRDMFLECASDEARRAYLDLFLHLFRTFAPQDRPAYLSELRKVVRPALLPPPPPPPALPVRVWRLT
jgi:hypothetical protein